jgi:copper chaperone
MERTITVEGMTCGGCEATVTRALEKMQGVTSARADHETNSVTVDLDPEVAQLSEITERIGELGFTVVGS